MDSLRIDLGPRSYDIAIRYGAEGDEFGSFVNKCLRDRPEFRRCRSTVVIADANIETKADHHSNWLAGLGFDSLFLTVKPGEASKSLAEAARLYAQLAAHRADRQTCIIAIGGGVIGDLAGFVAATYARGLPLIMVPTTLLAQVDSSVGGKVGVNLPAGKNLVGAFHQPIGVWINLANLDTLPDRERRCGLAEVVKYGVIRDPEFFNFLEANADRLTAGDPDATHHAVLRSCQIKAEVVTADEFERTGVRAILNFGHTVAHAIEAVAAYTGEWHHGEAVAAGMVAEARLAERLGSFGAEDVGRLATLLGRLGLPTAAPGLDTDALMSAMRLDKKNEAGAIRCVVPDRLGSVRAIDAPEDLLRAVVDDLVAGPPSRQGREAAWTPA